MTKELQKRPTLIDTQRYQEQFMKNLRVLCESNKPLTEEERTEFIKTISKALLSQGTGKPFTLSIEGGWFTFESFQSFIHRIAYLNSPFVSMTTERPDKVTVYFTIDKLWDIIINKCHYFFPLATSEAVHMSSEIIKRDEQKTVDFSSKDAL